MENGAVNGKYEKKNFVKKITSHILMSSSTQL